MTTLDWQQTTAWVSGATGAWGQEFCQQLLLHPIEKLILFARGEHRAADLAARLDDDRVRVHLGDVRDRARLQTSLAGVTLVIHLAALKRVEAAASSPFEAASVNIDGTRAVIETILALPAHLRPARCFYLSSDKACEPTTFYGATKFVAEQLWLGANVYSPRPEPPWFVAARAGNALFSTGSVLEIWSRQRARGEALTITDPTMTRFVTRLQPTVTLMLTWLRFVPGGTLAHPGDLYLQHVPAVTLGDLAEAFAPGYPTVVTGRRSPGEKQHEKMFVDGPSSFECRQESNSKILKEVLRLAGVRTHVHVVDRQPLSEKADLEEEDT